MFRFKAGNKFFTIDIEKYKIESIVLYGSYVRGDYDHKSDIDLLIIIKDCSPDLLSKIHISIADDLQVPVTWITLNTQSIFTEKCHQADYSLWAIKSAYKIIFSKHGYIEHALKNLSPYVNVEKTILEDRRKVDLVMKSYHNGCFTPEKTICFLARFFRNACIHFCYLYEIIEFGKYEAAKECFNLAPLYIPFCYTDYVTLFNLRRKFKSSPDNKKFIGNAKCYINDWYHIYLDFTDNILYLASKKGNHHFRNPLLYYSSKNKK